MPSNKKPNLQRIKKGPDTPDLSKIKPAVMSLDALELRVAAEMTQSADEVGVVNDEFEDGNTRAVRFSFIGAGQGGGNLAAGFYSQGYRRVCLFNTAEKDVAAHPAGLARVIAGDGGAGKDPAAGLAAAEQSRNDIFDMLSSSWGTDVDYGIVCVGLGGGTGSGSVLLLIEVVRQYMESIGQDPDKVGVIATLPSGEGPTVAENAIRTFKSLSQLNLAPMIIVDNNKVGSLFNASLTKIWSVCNQFTVTVFDWLNIQAAEKDQIIAFDRKDYMSVLDSGLLTFGTSSLEPTASKEKFGQAVSDHMKKNFFVDVDLKTSTEGAILLVGSEDSLDKIGRDSLQYGFDRMQAMLSENAKLHRGVGLINTDQSSVRIFTVVGGCDPPLDRLSNLCKESPVTKEIVSQSTLADFFGI